MYCYNIIGTLPFVTLYSAKTLQTQGSFVHSPNISTHGGFKFGNGTIYSVYVGIYFVITYSYIVHILRTNLVQSQKYFSVKNRCVPFGIISNAVALKRSSKTVV